MNPVGYEETTSGLLTIAVRTFMLNQAKEAETKKDKFDLFIAPPDITKFGILEIEKANDFFDMGYEKTRERLKEPEVKKVISEKLG